MHYKKLEENGLLNEYDICILWNTDGLPTSNSSKGQMWLVQAQIINIPNGDRRSHQFISGIYHSNLKKPCMTSFLRPWARTLRSLYNDGFDWQERGSNVSRHSKVIAFAATLDAHPRVMVQNLHLHSREFGCTCCEHPGESCKRGKGHNIIFLPTSPEEEPILRTKKRMYIQGMQSKNENLKHVNGVKGPSVASYIPYFNIAIAVLLDYMHVILLGGCRLLYSLWFSTKNKDEPFYINKNLRDAIDKDLQNIFPPDYVTRTPKTLENMNFWKASEIRECLLNYFPILLKDKLKKTYYDHFLMLSCATRLLLKKKKIIFMT